MPNPEKFKKSLLQFAIDDDTVSQINKGFESINDKAPKETKVEYFKRALEIMEQKVDHQKLKDIFEWNACCKGGAREKASKSFAKEYGNLSLDEKLEKIKNVPNMGQPIRNEDGTITIDAVNYFDGEKYLCACPNFHGLKDNHNVSSKYCFCCAGHFKYHYEIMLGVKLKTLEIISSPLENGGSAPCVIKYEII